MRTVEEYEAIIRNKNAMLAHAQQQHSNAIKNSNLLSIKSENLKYSLVIMKNNCRLLGESKVSERKKLLEEKRDVQVELEKVLHQLKESRDENSKMFLFYAKENQRLCSENLILKDKLRIANEKITQLSSQMNQDNDTFLKISDELTSTKEDLKWKTKELEKITNKAEKKSKALEKCQKDSKRHNARATRRGQRIAELQETIDNFEWDLSNFIQKYGHLKNSICKRNRAIKALKFIRAIAMQNDCAQFLRDILDQYALETKDSSNPFLVKLTAEQGFYVFTKLGLSKQKQAKLKRYLKFLLGFDVLPSRSSVQKIEDAFSKDDMFDVRTEIVDGKKCVVGELNDLESMVSARLTDMADSNKLIYDNCTKDAIWFGVFGDKGGNTTKLVGVLGNCKNPNSNYHMIPLGIYEGGEKSDDIRKFLPKILKQINSLKKISFMVDGKTVEKDVIQYLGGDLKFICAMFGHEGAVCKKNCPYCYNEYKRTNTLKNFDHRATSDSRSLLTYSKDSKIPGTNIKLNSTPVFELIEVENIIPPSLHIFMGVAQKYIFNFLMDLAASIDKDDDLEIGKISQAATTLKK